MFQFFFLNFQKFIIIAFAIFAVVLADVSHLSRRQFIPPPIPHFRSRLSSGNSFAPRAAATSSVAAFDSATQGPSPEDIATPEPEYIDIDLPPSGPAPSGPAPSGPALSSLGRSAPASSVLRSDGYHYRNPRRLFRVHRRH